MLGLLPIVVAAMTLLAQTERVPVDDTTLALARGVATAVESDDDAPITGSKERDAVLIAKWEWDESRFGWKWSNGRLVFIACRSGDHGVSWGPLQLQRVPRERACDPFEAPREWLVRAHDSVQRCSAAYQTAGVFDPSAALAQLASGSCWRARNLSRARVAAARSLLLEAAASAASDARDSGAE